MHRAGYYCYFVSDLLGAACIAHAYARRTWLRDCACISQQHQGHSAELGRDRVPHSSPSAPPPFVIRVQHLLLFSFLFDLDDTLYLTVLSSKDRARYEQSPHLPRPLPPTTNPRNKWTHPHEPILDPNAKRVSLWMWLIFISDFLFMFARHAHARSLLCEHAQPCTHAHTPGRTRARAHFPALALEYVCSDTCTHQHMHLHARPLRCAHG